MYYKVNQTHYESKLGAERVKNSFSFDVVSDCVCWGNSMLAITNLLAQKSVTDQATDHYAGRVECRAGVVGAR